MVIVLAGEETPDVNMKGLSRVWRRHPVFVTFFLGWLAVVWTVLLTVRG